METYTSILGQLTDTLTHALTYMSAKCSFIPFEASPRVPVFFLNYLLVYNDWKVFLTKQVYILLRIKNMYSFFNTTNIWLNIDIIKKTLK